MKNTRTKNKYRCIYNIRHAAPSSVLSINAYTGKLSEIMEFV